MPKQKTIWTAERIARLGFLVGQGFAAKRIADDPLIASTPNNVHRQAQRFGLAFRDAMATVLRLPLEAAPRYDASAAKRGVTREALIKLLVVTAAGESNLLDNIIFGRWDVRRWGTISRSTRSNSPMCPSARGPPLRWEPEHFERRLVKAFVTLDRLPKVRGPHEPWTGYAADFNAPVAVQNLSNPGAITQFNEYQVGPTGGPFTGLMCTNIAGNTATFSKTRDR